MVVTDVLEEVGAAVVVVVVEDGICDNNEGGMCNEGAVLVVLVEDGYVILVEGVGDTRNRLELDGEADGAPPVDAPPDDVDTVLEPTSIGSSFLLLESLFILSSSSLMSSNCEKRPESGASAGAKGRFSFSLPLLLWWWCVFSILLPNTVE